MPWLDLEDDILEEFSQQPLEHSRIQLARSGIRIDSSNHHARYEKEINNEFNQYQYCSVCKKLYSPKNPNAKYKICSEDCLDAAKKARQRPLPPRPVKPPPVERPRVSLEYLRGITLRFNLLPNRPTNVRIKSAKPVKQARSHVLVPNTYICQVCEDPYYIKIRLSPTCSDHCHMIRQARKHAAVVVKYVPIPKVAKPVPKKPLPAERFNQLTTSGWPGEAFEEEDTFLYEVFGGELITYERVGLDHNFFMLSTSEP